MSLTVDRDITGTTLNLLIQGVMDYSTVEKFSQLTKIPEGVSKVVVDFSVLEFIDSTGIGAILSMIYDSSERVAALEFVGLNDMVHELFDTVGVFRIMETLLKEGH